MEINFEANSERISNISGDFAAAVLETAISLREAKDFRSALKDTVGDIRRLCDAEYCGMMLVDKENENCELLGEDFAENSDLRPDDLYLGKGFYPVASTWKDTIAGSNCLIAKNDADMEVVKERNPVWHESLKNAGVRTIALFPLKGQDEEFGYMWAVNFDEDRSAQIKEILELTTFVLGSETSNYMMVNKLRELSAKDMLTGIMNRNEMNNYVDALSELPDKDVKPAGVIFADLNGLKRINDTKGHEAGDALLRNAAAALRELFDTEQVFRAGGDEFVVILTGVTNEEIEKKAGDFRIAQTHYPDVSFAIGCGYTADCRDVRRALADADERMYEDKRKYYANLF
jgi:diguanylate cyclase (GGDEF)-like protein